MILPLSFLRIMQPYSSIGPALRLVQTTRVAGGRAYCSAASVWVYTYAFYTGTCTLNAHTHTTYI